MTHGDGAGNGNLGDIGVISGLAGPSNPNNILYIQWEGATTSTQGYINAMSITVVPEPGSFALLAGIAALGGIGIRHRR